MHVVITVCEELHLVAVCRAPYTCLLILVTNARPRAIARGSKAVHLAGNVALRLYQMLLNSSGPAKDRAVEMGYGILPSYEGNGYMTEAVQGMIRWALRSKMWILWRRKPTRTTAHPSAYWKNAALCQTGKQGRKASVLWWNDPKQPER